MSLKDDFQTFTNNLKPNNINEMKTTVGEIAKKLNNYYYELEGDTTSHMYIVGSVGRETAIKGVSDLDILFDLPDETFKKFDAYKEKKQSSLLQEVKKVLQDRYSNTDISGDGQVVAINFTKYTVELVPGFKQSDDSFKYPDTNDGGSWKYTDPLPEIDESKKTAEDTDDNFKYIANMLRAWKNKHGFKFGGLLIDTITYKFLNERTDYKKIGFNSYLEMTKALFEYIKGLNKKQAYWFALGSNQEVYNCDNGKFITKAEKAYKKIKDLREGSSNVNKKLREVFGSQFPKKQSTENKIITASYSERRYMDTEQFIEDLFPVDIRYNLKIDCRVTQNGFRPTLLRLILKSHKYLGVKKHLEFYIDEIDDRLVFAEPYDIYWKVKNEGEIAIQKDCIRGQIKKTNNPTKIESSDFKGKHYVECYIIKDGVCVAKGHLNVPISNYEYIMG
ncbi:nucleotidyltransferase [Clostridium botulinum]|uniref:nucleotide-binding domain-containing protein n=1 Tax=Clostridium botulinum TaxID=1491 RepID=UPI000774990B|nr:nucleotidyltransferase domain-containing protein [Clostridium botulinum]AUN03597.1 nucleotidyltransferase [Clostridium botulinum]MBN3399145.1 nucleotidyltransferase [Clostridium botulinum]